MKAVQAMNDEAFLKVLGLRCHPFPVAPDDENFYMTAFIEQVIDEIVHGITARKGFMVLSGNVGVGKTTITRRILKILATHDVCTSLVFHTSLKDVDLLREINRDFGLTPQGSGGPQQLGDHLQKLNAFLFSQYEKGRNCAIIIDDAQNLDRESLELVRMISNLEAGQQKMVQILLVGQTELMTHLNKHVMRQLQSRIVIRKVLRCLSSEELRNYVRFKLNSTGDTGRIVVTRPAFWRIYRRSKGNFRRLNLLMDRCLYAACGSNQKRITYAIAGLADADLDPEKHRLKKRLLALAASVVLPLAVAVAAWGLHFFTARSLMADNAVAGRRYKVPHAGGLLTATAHAPQGTVAAPSARANGGASGRDEAIDAFLSIYQLDRYGSDFQRALGNRRLDRLAQRIYGETGYQLVQLESLPDAIRRRYGALAFSVDRNQPPVWLLFWRPRLELKHFYPYYKGREIVALQRILADRHLYRAKIDGVVGPRLTGAVVALQRQLDLPVTGFPDKVTLFWLSHSQWREGQWPKA